MVTMTSRELFNAVRTYGVAVSLCAFDGSSLGTLRPASMSAEAEPDIAAKVIAPGEVEVKSLNANGEKFLMFGIPFARAGAA